ncbi:hypothetical protein ACSBR2_016155 [Camellia fascicularis]
MVAMPGRKEQRIKNLVPYHYCNSSFTRVTQSERRDSGLESGIQETFVGLGRGGVYKRYEFLLGSVRKMAVVVWNNCAPPKVKFFGWLAWQGKVKTSSFLQRIGILDASATVGCVFCQNEVESVNHILLFCPFVWLLWSHILKWWGFQWAMPNTVEGLLQWWSFCRMKKIEKMLWKLLLLDPQCFGAAFCTAFCLGLRYWFCDTQGNGAAAVTAYKSTKKALNLIDSCWRTNPKWDSNRRVLADCAVGFGAAAIGGKYGATYVVTDPSDDPINPKLGSLRYSVIQTRPLWIIFARDMVITLKSELMTNSYKTIDGRGVKVEIAYGPCITIQGVSHVIVHEITIHDCKRGKSGTVRNSKFHAGHRADRMRCHCCVCFFSYLD